MKFLSNLNRMTRRSIILGAVAASLIGAGIFVTSMVSVSADSSSSNCNNYGFNGDSNAVIYCGAETTGSNSSPSVITEKYNHGDGVNSAASIQHIYSWAGISSSDVQNLSRNAQNGSVDINGNVYVGNKLVATNAITGGRSPITSKYGKSYRQDVDGTVFYSRIPRVSFLQNSISAYVVLSSSGKFEFAIMKPCGNFVKATPIPVKKPAPTPCYVCSELTSAADNRTQFTFTAKASADNGAVIKGYQFSFGDGSSQTVSTGNGTATTTHNYENAGSYNATVAVIVSVGGVTKSVTSANCAATVKVCPPPAGACTKLTSLQNSRSEFTFTGQGSVSNGPVITGYIFDFGDGTSQTVQTGAVSSSVKHTYANPGTYNANVTVMTEYQGVPKNFTSTACAATVKVCPPPAAECTDLKLIQNAGNPREVSAAVTYTTSDGATLKGVTFAWGDSTTINNGTQTTANHTYGADGTYTVTATLTFSAANGTVPASNCQEPVTITTVVPTCNELTIDVDNSTKTATVTNVQYTANNGTYEFTTLDWGDGSAQTTNANAVGQAHTYSANGPFTVVATTHFMVNGSDSGVTSSACQQPVSFTETPPATPPATPPVTPPAQLVNTGPGSMIGLFVAASVAGVVGYHMFMSRRLKRES